MRRILLPLAFTVAVALAAVQFVSAQAQAKQKAAAQKKSQAGAAQQKPKSSASQESAKPADRSADDKAIHANVEAFVKAYNAGDAKAVAALFTPEARIVTVEGETVAGREAIEQAFKDIFADAPQTQIAVLIDAISFIAPDLAIEVGSTKETPAPGETPEYGRYTVLHVKRDGKWLMAAARDNEGEPPTHHERLQPLEWLLGEWVDDGGSTVVHTVCRWSDDGNFLLQEMNVQVAGQNAMQVTQRIGWDPLSKRIRSWVFDTEGGFGEGVWARLGDSWVIKSTGVKPDGEAASATSVIVPAGKDGYVWRVHDRVIGDEVLPSLEVKVVRKPPTPSTAAK